MKRIVCIVFMLVSTLAFAQETENTSGKNRSEIKLNALSLALGAIDFEFERTINRKSSIGFSFLSNLRGSDDYVGLNNQNSISGFYRYYFGRKYASGIFVEGFGMYNTVENFVGLAFNQKRGYETVHDFGLGLGIGYKWVSRKGLVIQSNFALGKNLLNANAGEPVIGKIGVSIGWRF